MMFPSRCVKFICALVLPLSFQAMVALRDGVSSSHAATLAISILEVSISDTSTQAES